LEIPDQEDWPGDAFSGLGGDKTNILHTVLSSLHGLCDWFLHLLSVGTVVEDILDQRHESHNAPFDARQTLGQVFLEMDGLRGLHGLGRRRQLAIETETGLETLPFMRKHEMGNDKP
jgi:hypothetical protein